MSLKDADISELECRYNYVVKEYVHLAVDLAPKLEKFGKYRKELQLLTAEFIDRGVRVDDSNSLTQLIEKEIQKRNAEEQTPVKTEGHPASE